ncbi:hypothetical protein GEMRC1_006858 [Eukaryota sp. GEM-RC1]
MPNPPNNFAAMLHKNPVLLLGQTETIKTSTLPVPTVSKFSDPKFQSVVKDFVRKGSKLGQVGFIKPTPPLSALDKGENLLNRWDSKQKPHVDQASTSLPEPVPTTPTGRQLENDHDSRPNSRVYSSHFLLSLRVCGGSPLPKDVEQSINKVLASHASAASRKSPRQNYKSSGGRARQHSRTSSKVPTPMPKSANAYDVQEQKNKAKQDGVFAVLKETKGLLNKLSESNKIKIFASIVEFFNKQHPCSKTLTGEPLVEFKSEFVTHLFDKAVLEPTFVNLYSQLCLKLSKLFPGFSGILIAQCQSNFEKFFVQDIAISDEITDLLEQVKRDRFVNDGEVTEAQLDAERFYRENKLKAKVLGNVEFVASLILHSVIPAGVASTITKQLVQNFKKTMAIEGLIVLWTKLLESAGINEYIEKVVAEQIKEFSNDLNIPIRERCLCANWLDHYTEKQRGQARQQATLTSSQDVHKKSVDGFVDVTTSRKGGKAKVVIYTDDHAKKFAANIDRMGITGLLSEFYKLRLSEPDKTSFVADVLYHFTNLNKPLLRNQFQSIMKELLKDKNGLRKDHCAAGLVKFCKDGKYDDVLEDFPKAGEFLAPVLSNWLELGIVNRAQLIDSMVNVDPFNLPGLVTPFVDYRKKFEHEYEWLEKNEKVCTVLSSH